jgi:Na+(H+)/acetate symporter ActP
MFSSNENSSLAGLLLTYALTLSDDIIDTMFALTSVETRMVSVERISNFIKI